MYYNDLIENFVQGVIDTFENKGPCDFTCEFEYFVKDRLGVADEMAHKMIEAVADIIAKDLEEEFNARGYEVVITPYSYPYPEIVMRK